MSTKLHTSELDLEMRIQAVDHLVAKLIPRRQVSQPGEGADGAICDSSDEAARGFRWDFDQKWNNKK